MLKKHYDFSTPMFHLYETGTYYFSICVYTWHQNLMCIHVNKANTHMASDSCPCYVMLVFLAFTILFNYFSIVPSLNIMVFYNLCNV